MQRCALEYARDGGKWLEAIADRSLVRRSLHRWAPNPGSLVFGRIDMGRASLGTVFCFADVARGAGVTGVSNPSL